MPKSQANSIRSAGSQISKKSVGKKSYVDEALFGKSKNENGSIKPPLIYNKEQLKDLREKTEKGLKSDAIVISKEELDRMKSGAQHVSKDEKIQTKRLIEEQKDQQLAAAKARKAKMQALDKNRATKVPLTDYQKNQNDKNETLLTKAMQMLDEDHDDVKHMNQMMLYSKVVTIRDKQKEEQKHLEQEWIDEQKRLDIMMEIERLKTLKMQEEKEVRRKEMQRSGASVIVDQIKERELERIKEQELREREMLQMLKQIEVMKQEEVKQQELKKLRAQQLMVEVEEANKRAIDMKDIKKKEEKDLDSKIVEYNKSKAQREEERFAEEKRVKDEKEKEVQRLRDLQEKAQDRQSEIDALRAKRAFEESERIARDKERKELEHKQKVLQDLEEARQRQFSEKERRLAEQAKQERDEFMRIIIKQKEVEEQERRVEEEKKAMLKNHASGIRTQIIQNEEGKKQERLNYLEEGKNVRQKLEQEKRKIEAIKEKKLTELKGLDIPEKYQAELARKKIK